jgi:hypothetical protein
LAVSKSREPITCASCAGQLNCRASFEFNVGGWTLSVGRFLL